MTKAAGMVGRTSHTRGINALCIIALGAALAALFAADPATAAGTLEHEPYGKTKDGRAVDVYTMTNDHGMRVRFLSFGGTVTEISVPDRAGRVEMLCSACAAWAIGRHCPVISARSPAAMRTV